MRPGAKILGWDEAALKFLAVAMFVGAEQINSHDIRTIFIVYGSGYAAVFLTFTLMYLHAWRQRDRLGLNEMERLRTRHILTNHLAMAAIGLASVMLALALPDRRIGLAGYFYLVIAVYFIAAGFMFRRRERRVLQSMTTSAAT